jgi:hypothetical protein
MEVYKGADREEAPKDFAPPLDPPSGEGMKRAQRWRELAGRLAAALGRRASRDEHGVCVYRFNATLPCDCGSAALRDYDAAVKEEQDG